MKIEFEVPDKRVTDLLEGHALRYSDWLKSCDATYSGGSKVYTVVYDKEDDAEGTFSGKARIGRMRITAGLALMAENEPHAWGCFMADDADDLTADLAWQYLVFGKAVYG